MECDDWLGEYHYIKREIDREGEREREMNKFPERKEQRISNRLLIFNPEMASIREEKIAIIILRINRRPF